MAAYPLTDFNKQALFKMYELMLLPVTEIIKSLEHK